MMPIRNGSNFMRVAIESILSQTFDSLRLFVSNNCSTDNTARILAEYQTQDPRVDVVHQSKPLSITQNWQFCIDHIETPFMTFMPHDDCFTDDRAIERAIDILQNHPDIAAVYSDMRYIDENGNTIAKRKFRRVGAFSSKELLKRSCITTRNMFGIPLVIRADNIRKYSMDESFTYVGDVDLSYSTSLGKNVYYIPQILIANRFHSSNTTQQVMKDARKQFQLLAQKHNLTLSLIENAMSIMYALTVRLQKTLFFFYLRIRSFF
jgi:glycosyltransferase involved in cell wall biosynthesis